MNQVTDPESWEEGDLVFLTHEMNLIIGFVTSVSKHRLSRRERAVRYNFMTPAVRKENYFDTSSSAYVDDEIYNPKDAPYRAIKDLFKTRT